MSTDILKNIRLEPSKMRRQIFQNRYFYLIYVICLERHEKTDKIGTDNEYFEKKRRFASHHPGTLETPHPKIGKKYTISVSARTKIQPDCHYAFSWLVKNKIKENLAKCPHIFENQFSLYVRKNPLLVCSQHFFCLLSCNNLLSCEMC